MIRVETRLPVAMLPQPDDTSCGPTCLHALYHYYRDPADLAAMIEEIPQLEGGGTLAVQLACHALRRGYRASIHTYNLQIFDPTWFEAGGIDLAAKLRQQMAAKADPKLRFATECYLEFLAHGGEIFFEDLTTALIRKYLARQVPMLTGLSATFLYRAAREYGPDSEPDDIRGEPAGHFVILSGYDKESRQVLVADPLGPRTQAAATEYCVNIDRLVCSILLGILTYDANLLVLEPASSQ